MKRILRLLMFVLLFASCTVPTDSTDVVSSVDSVAEESKNTSSDETNSVFREIDGIKYYDVMASGAKDVAVFKDPFTGATQGNHSEYFPEDAEGYYLDDMLFLVDRETFFRVLSKPVAGTGAIKWMNFDPARNFSENLDKFDGILPVDKMDDPLYVYMCRPSDLEDSHSFNMALEAAEYEYILPMAVILNIEDKPIPDDAEVTICIGRMTMSVYTEKDGWVLVQDLDVPSTPKHIYYLPWSLEATLGRMTLPEDRVKLVDDHYEVTLTGADLHGADKVAEGATGSVLHFWGTRYYIPERNTILGMTASFECWIKEEEWTDCLLASVGIDWKTSDGGGKQVFTGHGYAVTTDNKIVFGHNVGPKLYDEIMDTEKLQEFMGLR